MKSGELEKRKEKREEAENALAKAKEEGNMEEVDKQVKTLKLNVSWQRNTLYASYVVYISNEGNGMMFWHFVEPAPC